MKSIISNKIVTLLGIVLFVFTLLFSPLSAYEIERLSDTNNNLGDFVVGPGKIELNLKPGDQRVVPLKISNRLGETKQFHLEVEDFTGSQNPKETVVLLGSERGPYSLKSYISFSETDFELKAGERATVPVVVSIPVDAEPGGLFGSVLVSVTSNSEEMEVGGGGSAIISRIGTLFFVTVPGDVNKDGRVTDFGTVGKEKFFGKGPINFEILYENKSSVHLNPYGNVSITNMYGEEVGFVEIDPWFALPASLRLREVTWNREFLFGKYTATAQINRGYDDIIDTKEFSFYVLPWRIALSVVGGLAIVIFLIRLIGRKFEFRRKN
ncbi:MAG: DUF916 domain-containing protein [bacterium]|nr:DUF916 domain-containing protein [bacterium]